MKDRFLPVRIFEYPVPVAAERRGTTYESEYGYLYSTMLYPTPQRAASAGQLEFGVEDFWIATIRDGQLAAFIHHATQRPHPVDLATHQARLEWIWT